MWVLNGAKIREQYNEQKRLGKQRQDESSSKTGRKGDDQQELKIRPGEKLGDYNRRIEQSMASQVAATARSVSRREKKRKRAELARAEADEEQRTDEATRKDKAGRAAQYEDDEPSSKELKRAREEMTGRRSDSQEARNGTAGASSKEIPLDFAKASQIRRVRDVVDAPPQFSKLPRGQGKEAQARKASVAAALSGQDPTAAGKAALGANKRSTVTAGQMPMPVASKQKGRTEDAQSQSAGGLKRQKDLEEERNRVIKLYRQRKEQQMQQRQQRSG